MSQELEAGYEFTKAQIKELEQLRAALADAVGALEIAETFCGNFTAEECPDIVAIPINEALNRCKEVLNVP